MNLKSEDFFKQKQDSTGYAMINLIVFLLQNIHLTRKRPKKQFKYNLITK